MNKMSCANNVKYITEDDVKCILKKSRYANNDLILKSYYVHNASDKMLGFLSDYWRLNICVTSSNEAESRKDYYFFIKAVSRSNAAKATMVKEMNLFQKELNFYSVIKHKLELPDIKPWSARFITTLEDAMVFEDLSAFHYTARNKFMRFDMAHTLQALNTLARFQASSIIYEENKSKEMKKPYKFNDDYGKFLDKGGYRKSDPWFIQCMNGAFEAVKSFSKHSTNEECMKAIEKNWQHVWFSALELSDFSIKYRNVICHRDLWNNNILFHYKNNEEQLDPNDCVLVDFQAIRCQPPAGDLMLLLCCNLDPKFREEHLYLFLKYYYETLTDILSKYDIKVEDVIREEELVTSAEEQRKWGLVVCACLIPQFWLDDDLSTNIFCDSQQFNDILSQNKGSFIRKMMDTNADYRKTVLEILDEIIERYCLTNCNK